MEGLCWILGNKSEIKFYSCSKVFTRVVWSHLLFINSTTKTDQRPLRDSRSASLESYFYGRRRHSTRQSHQEKHHWNSLSWPQPSGFHPFLTFFLFTFEKLQNENYWNSPLMQTKVCSVSLLHKKENIKLWKYRQNMCFVSPAKIQILKCYQTLMQWKNVQNWTFIMFIIWLTKYQNNIRSGERLDQVYWWKTIFIYLISAFPPGDISW